MDTEGEQTSLTPIFWEALRASNDCLSPQGLRFPPKVVHMIKKPASIPVSTPIPTPALTLPFTDPFHQSKQEVQPSQRNSAIHAVPDQLSADGPQYFALLLHIQMELLDTVKEGNF